MAYAKDTDIIKIHDGLQFLSVMFDNEWHTLP